MWPKVCVVLVTKYDLLSQQNLEPLSYLFIFWISADNIKDLSLRKLKQHERNSVKTGLLPLWYKFLHLLPLW